jgi:hypothetical protein
MNEFRKNHRQNGPEQRKKQADPPMEIEPAVRIVPQWNFKDLFGEKPDNVFHKRNGQTQSSIPGNEMPVLNEILQNNNDKCADAVNRDEGAKNKSGVDKLALLEGSVKNLQHPPDKAIDCKKDNIIKETQILIDHDILHIKLYHFTVVFRPTGHPVAPLTRQGPTLIRRTTCNNLLKFSVMLHYPIIFVKHFLLELLS